MKRFWIATVIFLALATTVPVFYFMIADGALMPFGGLGVLLVFHLMKAPILVVLDVVHIVIYGTLLAFISRSISRCICANSEGLLRLSFVSVLILGILLIGFFSVFSGGHGDYDSLNAFQFYPMICEKLFN